MWRAAILAAVITAAPGLAQASEVILPRAVTDADYASVNAALVPLGRDLYFDRILSGNRNIACSTCHHPRFGTSDGVSLTLGEGAVGLGPKRHAVEDDRPEQRVPRNAPALFNLGAREFTRLFHDGRLEADATRPSGLRTPLEDEMVAGFDGVLSAQSMFPVLSPDEMAGHYAENDVAQAVRQGLITGPGGAWDRLAGRVAAIPAYAERFRAALPEVAAGRPVAFTDIANALAAFIATEYRADDSPFDRHLRGEAELQGDARTGMLLFYGRAGCATCHSGPFQTNQGFHAVAVPQLGPGKAARFERHQRDLGRMRVTGDPADAYRFRTPSLRNVGHTAPYGHSGAYGDLRAMVRHMADPAAGFATYDRTQAVLARFDSARPDWAAGAPEEAQAVLAANEGRAVALDDQEIDQIVAFLEALTDRASLPGRLGAPDHVPSGLPLD